MYNTKRQKNMIIGGLLAIVCIMAIGYAAFATNLNISGSGAISSNWSVKITNITSKDIVGTAGNKSTPSYTDTTATFATTLQSPRDSITYDITVSNEGSLDAKLDKITLTDNTNPAITFETSGLAEGDSLLKETSKVLSVKVTYNNSVTSQPENLTANLTVTLDFSQKTVSSGGSGGSSGGSSTVGDKLVSSEGTVTTGDGLYADTTQTGRYFYRGSSVDNYITFNDETWRIMSVESDGTIKIIKDASIGSMKWDAPGTRSSSTSTYCTNASSYGCNAWAATSNLVGTPTDFTVHSPNGNPTSYSEIYSGTVTKDASLNTYLNGTYYNSLSATAQSYITSHNFNVGTPGNTSDTEDIATDVAQEAIYKWNGKIGLMNITEFMRTTTSTSCTSLKAGSDSSSACSSNNWMFKSISEWTLSPDVISIRYTVWRVDNRGYITNGLARDPNGVRPALYLKSSITLTGSGTSADPYVITG